MESITTALGWLVGSSSSNTSESSSTSSSSSSKKKSSSSKKTVRESALYHILFATSKYATFFTQLATSSSQHQPNNNSKKSPSKEKKRSRFLCYIGQKGIEASNDINKKKECADQSCWCCQIDDSAAVAAFYHLGCSQAKEGRTSDAITAWNNTLSIQRKTLGIKHPEVAKTLMAIGAAHSKERDTYLALTAFEESLWIYQETLGTGHRETADAAYNLWVLLHNESDDSGNAASSDNGDVDGDGDGDETKMVYTYRGVPSFGSVDKNEIKLVAVKKSDEEELASLENKLEPEQSATHLDTSSDHDVRVKSDMPSLDDREETGSMNGTLVLDE